jgi:hypothetical protein
MMMSTIKRLALYAGISLCGLSGLPACIATADAIDVPGSPGIESPSSEVAPRSEHRAPSVTMDFGNGTTIELYDYPKGVLVGESGKAGEPTVLRHQPAIQALLRANRFVEAFAALQPNQAMPAALLDLQARHPEVTTGLSTASAAKGSVAPPPRAAGASAGGGGGLTPDTCSNDCCNATWLEDNICDGVTGWFDYDYGWSYENVDSIVNVYAAACAVSGTSEFSIDVDGDGGSWPVAAGYYQYFSWYSTLFPWDMTSNVNTEADQHEHTYCGNAT